MLQLLLVLFGAFLLLVCGEVLKKQKTLDGEAARKFIHISFGVYVASWSFVLERNLLLLACGALLPVILLSHYLHIFKAIHTGKERLVGEILYAVALFITAVLATEPWMFTSAVLVLAVADGTAAIVGKKHGHKTPQLYRSKTLAGTAAFFVCSVVALLVGYAVGGREAMSNYAFVVLVWLPLFLAFVELVSPWGTDNLFVPLITVYVLRILAGL